MHWALPTLAALLATVRAEDTCQDGPGARRGCANHVSSMLQMDHAQDSGASPARSASALAAVTVGGARQGVRGVNFSSILDSKFENFGALASHNSYLWGMQSDPIGGWIGAKVDANSAQAIPMNLNLGYRYIEIDIWPLQKCTGLWPFRTCWTEMHVFHAIATHRWTDPTVHLHDIVWAIEGWLKNDERKNPASESNPKFPLIIQLDHHVNEHNDQRRMVKAFKFLGESRIVKPSEFSKGTTMRSVTALSGQRKIIFLSKMGDGQSNEFEALVAMRRRGKEGRSGNPNIYLSESIKSGDDWEVNDEAYKKEKKARSDGYLVKTGGTNMAMTSFNFDAHRAFDAEVNFISVNPQGRCWYKMCKNPERAQPGCVKDKCECNREGAYQLEEVFFKYGHDGYLHYPSLTQQEKGDIKMKLNIPKSKLEKHCA